MFFMSIGLVIQNEPETLFIPENMPAYVNIFIEKPIGTDIEETNEFTKFIEEEVFEVIEPYVGVV